MAQDDSQAALWYQRAAGQGDAGACYIIASMYDKGYGVQQDPERAAFWYGQAALRGEPGAADMARAARRKAESL